MTNHKTIGVPDHHTGLSSQEAARLLAEYGPNSITEGHRKPLIIMFLEQFKDTLTLLLIVAAAFAFVVGEVIDGMLISIIVLLNGMFGLYQESKAENAIGALKDMTRTMVRVIRDGHEQEIASEDLVPGDICYIEEGVKVPADGEVIESTSISANEAALTGESVPVSKHPEDMVFAGTIVARGRGYIKVIETGMRTKFGEIAAGLSSIDRSTTLLEKKLAKFSRLLGFLGVGAAFTVIALSAYQGNTMLGAILLGISLAVAVVPEGLQAVMTITMAIGVREMAQRKAILRKLSAIEALGSVSLIATDKTGTLTANSMRVKEVWWNGQDQSLEGLQSWGSDGRYRVDSTLTEIIRCGLLCSTASLERHTGEAGKDWHMLGDPTEGALLVLGEDLGTAYQSERDFYPIVHERPFDSDSKRMVTTVQKAGAILSYAKGATESILDICTSIERNGTVSELTDSDREMIRDQMNRFADNGLRVLAMSYKRQDTGFADWVSGLGENAEDSVEQALSNQTFLGLVAMYDPPRLEVSDAIARAHNAGIGVVMVTGDNPRTARAIGLSIGLMKEGDLVLSGDDLDQITDQELLAKLPSVSIFARVSPFHKSRIVKLFQQRGEVVAVTGDGVNDSIALKQADVGVAMGKIGTDVARETADMVITDDNFATIINAIEEGRNIIKNIRSAIKYLLSTNVVEALTIILGIMMGFPKMFTAVQILYINLLSDGIPSLILAFSPRDEKAMERPPEREISLLSRFDIRYIVYLGAAATVLVLGSFLVFTQWSIPGVDPRAVVFIVLTLIQPFFLIDLWISHQSYRKNLDEFTRPVFIGAFIYPFILLYMMLSVPELAMVFKLAVVPSWVYLMCVGIASLIMIAIWVFKKLSHDNRRVV